MDCIDNYSGLYVKGSKYLGRRSRVSFVVPCANMLASVAFRSMYPNSSYFGPKVPE